MPPREDSATTIAALVGAMSSDQLRRALAAAPHVVAAFGGTGPLAGYFEPRPAGAGSPATTRHRIAAHLGHVATRRLTVQLLDQLSLQLLTVLVSAGGKLSDSELATETEPLSPSQRDALVTGLQDRLLVRRTPGGIATVEGVDAIIGRSGRSVQSLLGYSMTSSDAIGAMLRKYGVRSLPSRKQERIDQLASIIGDRDNLRRIFEQLHSEARALLELLIDAGPAGMAASAVGMDAWHFRVYDRLPRRQVPSTIGALMQLDDLGLVWVEPMADLLGTWIEVVRAHHGRLIATWSVPAEPTSKHISDTDAHLPVALSTLHGLLDRVAAEAIVGLKSGGIGVKVIRDLAKRLGQPDRDVELLLFLALALGLLRHEEEIVGRGRNATWVHRYAIDPDVVAHHTAAAPGEQWVALVEAWAAGRDSDDDRFHQVVVRFQVLQDLLALPVGTGIALDAFGEWIRSRHWIAGLVQVDALVADLRALGLVPAEGPLGLTATARVLLTDPTRVDELLPAAIGSFVVQADHTVVAPPTLEPGVRSTLERLATVQSTGSATVYRLDPTRIGAYLADGHSAASIREFLEQASTVGVPPTVARLLDDLERQRGGLAVHTAATVVTADDVMGLAAAVKVKAAKLTLLAPTVAVSDLAPAKVIAALRAKGLAPSVANGRVSLGTGTGGSTTGAGSRSSGDRNATRADGAPRRPAVPRTRSRPHPIAVADDAIDALLDGMIDGLTNGARR